MHEPRSVPALLVSMIAAWLAAAARAGRASDSGVNPASIRIATASVCLSASRATARLVLPQPANDAHRRAVPPWRGNGDSEPSSDGLRHIAEMFAELGEQLATVVSHRLTRDQAFDLLRVASQHQNRKLRDVAVEVGDTGTSH